MFQGVPPCGAPYRKCAAKRMADEEQTVRIRGTVEAVLRDATFKVKTDQGLQVIAKASGRMRRGRKIRILPGDAVDVEISLYDPTKGRIVFRHK